MIESLARDAMPSGTSPMSAFPGEGIRESHAFDAGWTVICEELDRLRTLEADFDGEGSPVPSPALFDWADELAVHLQVHGDPAADRVILGVNGTILFEWYGSGIYREIEIAATDAAELRVVRNDRPGIVEKHEILRWMVTTTPA